MADADAATSNSMGIANTATGQTPGTGNPVEVTLGFKPRHVILFDADSAARYEKFEAMADTDTVKTVTGGAQTVDENSAIVIAGERGQFRGFTVSADVAKDGADMHWIAFG